MRLVSGLFPPPLWARNISGRPRRRCWPAARWSRARPRRRPRRRLRSPRITRLPLWRRCEGPCRFEKARRALMDEEDVVWQRLDKFLFYARFCKTRAVAVELIEHGGLRINRQPTEKPHARLRAGA